VKESGGGSENQVASEEGRKPKPSVGEADSKPAPFEKPQRVRCPKRGEPINRRVFPAKRRSLESATVLGRRADHHIVFAAQAELTWDVDPRLIGEGHTGLENGFAAANQIRMLVAVEANTMAQTVSEEFIVGSIPRGVTTARAASSTVPESRPARAASSAASCDLRTISNTREILSEGVPKMAVRVTSDS